MGAYDGWMRGFLTTKSVCAALLSRLSWEVGMDGYTDKGQKVGTVGPVNVLWRRLRVQRWIENI